jgi:hypothetical protein
MPVEIVGNAPIPVAAKAPTPKVSDSVSFGLKRKNFISLTITEKR